MGKETDLELNKSGILNNFLNYLIKPAGKINKGNLQEIRILKLTG